MSANVSRNVFKDARDWLNALLFLSADGSGMPQDWVFRGIGSVEYKLVPSALRVTCSLLDATSHRLRGGLRASAFDQFTDELATLTEFFRVSDATGLPLPEDSQLLRRELFSMQRDAAAYVEEWSMGVVKWPSPELASLMGLAQHYGTHTRMLDWSFSARVAAYFAVETAAGRKEPTDVAVWALNRTAVQYPENFAARPAAKPAASVRFITAPSAWNQNLRAQRGLFTVCDDGRFEPSSVIVTALEDVIEASSKHTNPVLLQFVLQGTQVREALRLLVHQDINASTVYPGFAGVTAALKERDKWS